MRENLASAGTGLDVLDDVALVGMARHGDEFAIRALIKRHNQRLFRTARAVMRDDGEAEDVVQASYVAAFTQLEHFRGEAQFSTWLTRIALNEALGRRRRRPTIGLEHIAAAAGQIIPFPGAQPPIDPESEMSRVQVRQILEQAIDGLPASFRAVFVLRDVEGMSIAETAALLALRPETVSTRLHRARALLRRSLEQQFSGAFSSLFPSTARVAPSLLTASLQS